MSANEALLLFLAGLPGEISRLGAASVFVAADLPRIVTALAFVAIALAVLRKRAYGSYVGYAKRFFLGALSVFAAPLATLALVDLTKLFFAAPRPFVSFPDIEPLFYYGMYDSFPSGHAAFFASLAAAFYRLDRRLGLAFGAAAFAIGAARVVAGIHFPGDVLAGFALGALVALMLRPLQARLQAKAL